MGMQQHRSEGRASTRSLTTAGYDSTSSPWYKLQKLKMDEGKVLLWVLLENLLSCAIPYFTLIHPNTLIRLHFIHDSQSNVEYVALHTPLICTILTINTPQVQ